MRRGSDLVSGHIVPDPRTGPGSQLGQGPNWDTIIEWLSRHAAEPLIISDWVVTAFAALDS